MVKLSEYLGDLTKLMCFIMLDYQRKHIYQNTVENIYVIKNKQGRMLVKVMETDFVQYQLTGEEIIESIPICAEVSGYYTSEGMSISILVTYPS